MMQSHNMSSMAPMSSMYHNYSTPMHMSSPFGMFGGKGEKSNRVRNPNELFVGDLSFFCEEVHLFEVFGRFGPVAEARVKKSDKGGKSLMYGFVRMENLPDAVESAKQLNGSLFMGREIKVQLSMSNTYYDSSTKVRDGYQIHLSFLSFFPEDRIVFPTEDRIRSIMEKCGPLADIMIKEYRIFKDQQKQEGFAYVTFMTEEGANTALVAYNNMDIDGIHFECILSLRNKMSTTIGNAARPNPMMGGMSRQSPYCSIPHQMGGRPGPSYGAPSSMYQNHGHGHLSQPSYGGRDIHPSMYARDSYSTREQYAPSMSAGYGGNGQYGGGRGPVGPSYGSVPSMPGRGPYPGPSNSQQTLQRLQQQAYGAPMREQGGYRPQPDQYRSMSANQPRYGSNSMHTSQGMYSSGPSQMDRFGSQQDHGMNSFPMPSRESQFSSDRFDSAAAQQYRSQANAYFSEDNYRQDSYHQDNYHPENNGLDAYLNSTQHDFDRDLLMPARAKARSGDSLSLDFTATTTESHNSAFSIPSVFGGSLSDELQSQFLEHGPSGYSIERPVEQSTNAKSFPAAEFHSAVSDDHTDDLLSSSISSLSLDKA